MLFDNEGIMDKSIWYAPHNWKAWVNQNIIDFIRLWHCVKEIDFEKHLFILFWRSNIWYRVQGQRNIYYTWIIILYGFTRKLLFRFRVKKKDHKLVIVTHMIMNWYCWGIWNCILFVFVYVRRKLNTSYIYE
jgi:hypothetical protein